MHLAVADIDACSGCRRCARQCPFSAITIDQASRRAVVDPAKCYGCGVCRAVCDRSALTLVARDARDGGVPVPTVVSA